MLRQHYCARRSLACAADMLRGTRLPTDVWGTLELSDVVPRKLSSLQIKEIMNPHMHALTVCSLEDMRRVCDFPRRPAAAREVARAAGPFLPQLADVFPWLASVASPIVGTAPPAEWAALVQTMLPMSTASWLDVLFSISNHPSFATASEIVDTHDELIKIVDLYGESSASALLVESGVLRSALTPQWLRKLRKRYIEASRPEKYSELFFRCLRAEMRLSRRSAVPSLVDDDEHLPFVCAIHGRREVVSSKERRWQNTTRDLNEVMTTLFACPLSVQQREKHIEGCVKVALNVAVFLLNDGNEAQRVSHLLQILRDMPCEDNEGRAFIASAIVVATRSLARKVQVTRLGALESVLAAFSFLITIRHALALPDWRPRLESFLLLAPSADAPTLLPPPITRVPTRHVQCLVEMLAALQGALPSGRTVPDRARDCIAQWLASEAQAMGVASWSQVAALVEGLAAFPRQDAPSVKPLTWTCGCGARSTLEAQWCWQCGSSSKTATCTKCPLKISSDSEVCRCGALAPWSAAMHEQGVWRCEKCSTVSPVDSPRCSHCDEPDPARTYRTCEHCGTQTTGRSLLCSACGFQFDPRALLYLCNDCGRCNARPAAAAWEPHCQHCSSKTVTAIGPASWICGCGTENSAVRVGCRQCGGDNVYRCPSCSSRSTGKVSKSPSSHIPPLLCCSHCDADHPLTEALLRHRIAPCDFCPRLIAEGESCSCGIGRFEHTHIVYPNLPWPCHTCGSTNGVHMADAGTASMCGVCDVDRISPLVVDAFNKWDCTACGRQSIRGFACHACGALQPGLPAAEVHEWVCAGCRFENPSWCRECQNPHCTHSRRDDCAVCTYEPWTCQRCTVRNSLSSFRCASCNAAREVIQRSPDQMWSSADLEAFLLQASAVVEPELKLPTTSFEATVEIDLPLFS